MKYTVISEKNIELIKFRLKQFIERVGSLSMVSHYPTNKLRTQVLGSKEDGLPIITKSNPSILTSDDYLLEIERDVDMGETPFIRVNYNEDQSGFLLKVGDKIRIATTSVHVFKEKSVHENGEANARTIWRNCNPPK